MTIVTKEKIDGYEIAIQPSDKLFVLVPIDVYKELVLVSKKYDELEDISNWTWKY